VYDWRYADPDPALRQLHHLHMTSRLGLRRLTLMLNDKECMQRIDIHSRWTQPVGVKDTTTIPKRQRGSKVPYAPIDQLVY
jgi:hypothetical protein